MITQETFDKIALQFNCGYWFVCDDHACGCSPSSAVGKGFSTETYASMQENYKKYLEMLDKEFE